MITPLGQEVPLPPLSSRDRDGVTVVSLRGELDFSDSSALQDYLSDIRRQTRPRSVADLTSLTYIDCACLTVVVRHCKDIRSQGGSFVLAAPHGTVNRMLALTGLLTWFEMHDTVEEAIRRSSLSRGNGAPEPPCSSQVQQPARTEATLNRPPQPSELGNMSEHSAFRQFGTKRSGLIADHQG